MVASREDQREAVRTLLQVGGICRRFNLASFSRGGRPLKDYACIRLQLGADPTHASRDGGRTACDIAEEMGLQVGWLGGL